MTSNPERLDVKKPKPRINMRGLVSCDVTTFLDLTSFKHLWLAEMVLLCRNNATINKHVKTHTLTRDSTRPGQYSRKRVQPLKKGSKSCFLDFQKKRKKRNHLVITQLPEVGTGKSRSPTSNILLRKVDTRNYATENCVINAYRPSTHSIPEF